MEIDWTNSFGIFEAWLNEKGLHEEFLDSDEDRTSEIVQAFSQDEDFFSRVPECPPEFRYLESATLEPPF